MSIPIFFRLTRRGDRTDVAVNFNHVKSFESLVTIEGGNTSEIQFIDGTKLQVKNNFLEIFAKLRAIDMDRKGK